MILESVTWAKRDDGQNMMCNIDIWRVAITGNNKIQE